MKLSIGETSKLMGVSIRTLHYYDEIGLLKPSEKSDVGYRFYDDKKLALLQQILFYRELQLPLKEIISILSRPDYEQKQALKMHRELLLLKQEHLGELIKLVDSTLGGNKMSKFKITAEDIKNTKEKFANEVREKWGKTSSYSEFEQKHSSYSNEKEESISHEAEEIFYEFAGLIGRDVSSSEVQSIVEKWRNHITKYYYECTKEIFLSLSEMYVGDKRFQKNIDRYGDGLAEFMSDAIKVYCSSQK